MPKKSTRNAPGSGTIRQRKDGTWEARYTVGRDPGTGKQIQRSVYAKTKAEVAKKMRTATHEIDEGIYIEPSKLTVERCFTLWLDEYLGSVKDSTREQYRYHLRVNIRPAMGAVKLTELTAPMVQKMYNDCIRRGLSPKSVRNLHGVMHRALDKAVKLRYIRINPCTACEPPRVEKKEIKPIEGDHVKAFLQAIHGHQYEDVLFFTIFSGMRQGEVLGLTWDCVDFKQGQITVNKQLQKKRQVGGGGEYSLVSLKNDKSRTLAPAPDVLKLLRRVQVEQKKNRLKAGRTWSNPMNLVFTNELGGHLVALTVYRNFKRIAEQIGIPSTRFHDLRHPYVKHTTKKYNSEKQKTQATKIDLIAWVFRFCTFNYSKRSWTL